MWVVSHFVPTSHWIGGWVGLENWSGLLRKHIFPLPLINPRLHLPAHSHYADWYFSSPSKQINHQEFQVTGIFNNEKARMEWKVKAVVTGLAKLTGLFVRKSDATPGDNMINFDSTVHNAQFVNNVFNNLWVAHHTMVTDKSLTWTVS
jgi:hypothetical protein